MCSEITGAGSNTWLINENESVPWEDTSKQCVLCVYFCNLIPCFVSTWLKFQEITTCSVLYKQTKLRKCKYNIS